MIHSIGYNGIRARLEHRVPMALIEGTSRTAYDALHLPGAIYLHPERVPELGPEYLPDRHVFIVTYGEDVSDKAPWTLARRLLEAGYDNVHVYFEGKRHWLAQSLPIETSPAHPAQMAPAPAAAVTASR